MKKNLLFLLLMSFASPMFSQQNTVSGPDGKLILTVLIRDSIPFYSAAFNGIPMLEESPLGLITSIGDFSSGMQISDIKKDKIDKEYLQDKIKRSSIHYEANELTVSFINKKNQKIDVVFRVSNNDIGFCYRLLQHGESEVCIIEKELTGFNFPQKTSTFLSPQATPMIGWKRTKPSYEEGYNPDEPIGTPSRYGLGYTFPSLFHIGEDGWVLISETGVRSTYCGSHLSEGTAEGLYTIAYPDPGENNGLGSAVPGLSLPGSTPWRTLTIGNSLKPIVETTIPYDLTEPLYEPSQEYKYGRSTWSWIMWQDRSMNYDDQVTYINLAADLGYEFILIDALWDTEIGYDRMSGLIEYAHSKGVDVFLWYNSNGYWNDAPQGPKNKLSNAVARKKEMKWLQSMGVKGLKVDFFGGDKQETMKLYEDILTDANEYGLMIIFHGCTLPRGWERMFPNYVGSEAVLASENLIFGQRANDIEAFSACLHPFIRNATGCMEFGPVLLNKRHNRTNDGGTRRRTTDIFQLATAILFQNPVQMFALTPNNLTDVPSFEIDFMKNVPTTWDETLFLDGYPGKYCILARRHNNKWYIAGVNAQSNILNLKIQLPILSGKELIRYGDDKDLVPFTDRLKVNKKGEIQVIIQANGGIILLEY
ncbi:MAG: glycoside hydrolase family 97 protein [Bacteroidales bacterium]|nr:glycoside hydrolase family 97 protein [Bacteroidales bacterium]